MFYRINEVRNITASGNTYIHVDFWRREAHFRAGDPPYLTNSFYINLRPLQYVITRRDGFLLKKDGTYIDPVDAGDVSLGDFEPRDGLSLRETIVSAIEKYGRRFIRDGWSGDHTEDTTKVLKKNGTIVRQGAPRLITRDDTDPNRVFEDTTVTSLRGAEKEI